MHCLCVERRNEGIGHKNVLKNHNIGPRAAFLKRQVFLVNHFEGEVDRFHRRAANVVGGTLPTHFDAHLRKVKKMCSPDLTQTCLIVFLVRTPFLTEG
jgi:hypothetical protein